MFQSKGPSGPENDRALGNAAYLREVRLLRRERFVGHLLRYAVLAVIAGASVWGTARASAEPPPPVQQSITETIHDWWDWWWGIRPHVKTRRTYIGGDG